MSLATFVLAQPAAALDANYWRGEWRTPLGDELSKGEEVEQSLRRSVIV
jgi:hypothetical protein